MVRYSLFVLKVPLNPKQTNKQITGDQMFCIVLTGNGTGVAGWWNTKVESGSGSSCGFRILVSRSFGFILSLIFYWPNSSV